MQLLVTGRRSRVLLAIFSISITACADPGGAPGDQVGGHTGDHAGAPSGAPVDHGPPVADLPAALDLGDGDCGGTASATLRLANTGASQLAFDFSASDPRLEVAPRTGTLAPGASLAVRVTAQVPADVGAGETLPSVLVATTNAGMRTIPVALRTRGAQLVLDPPAIGFGQVAVGFPSASSFVLRNVGNAPATVAIAPTAGELSGQLAGAGGGAIVLAPGAQATGTASYLPRNLGLDAAAPAVTIGGPTCGARPSRLELSGEGVAGAGVMVQGGPINFGVVGCDAGGQTKTITLVNPAAIDAPFSARFLEDLELDHLRFSVTPASGAVPAHGSIALQIRRTALPAPATPRVHDTVLRIATTLGVETVTDVPVFDDVRSPLLQVSADRRDFGFALVGESVSLPIRITNTGNALASLKAAGPFQVLLPMPIAPGATGTAWAVYKPTAAPAPISGSVTLSATGSCQAAVSLPFQAGTGPYAMLVPGGIALQAGCPAPPRMTAALEVINAGNRSLQITCRESGPSELALQFASQAMTVPAQSAGSFLVSMATGESEPGVEEEISAFVECTTNEPVTSTRTTSMFRAYYADYELCIVP